MATRILSQTYRVLKPNVYSLSDIVALLQRKNETKKYLRPYRFEIGQWINAGQAEAAYQTERYRSRWRRFINIYSNL
ncbi:hypothetical protein ACGGX0_001020 [Salmonella enterica]|nr:hypothetical protein [Salmonella enterica subsp. houtenae serovar 40:z4,z24:-]EJX4508654.1 hypothetical protein [Salmonella enterica]HBZ8551002.1 hypothetical protein [Salmonella enterica subsp. houtenae]EKS4588618.1 hypothetical protein [Salmonella enterica]EKS4833221.1 hypothetical protein [Salmonella enterica]